MNKQLWKIIRDKMPESLKYIGGKVVRNKLVHNDFFLHYYNFLNETSAWSTDQIKEYQLKQLRRVLTHAYDHVPYYTDLFNNINFRPDGLKELSDIEAIPFLTKELIQQNFNKLTSNKKAKGGHYAATTGGTTGKPLSVLHDYNSIFKEMAFIYHFRKKLNYNLSDRLVTFRGVQFGAKLYSYSPMYNELIFSPYNLSSLTVNKYVERINAYKPDYLNGYLSSLYFFAKLLEENQIQLKVKLKGMFMISENMDMERRQYIEKFFGVKSQTFYGHTERCIIAEEVSEDHYKPNPFYGFTELIKNSEGGHEITGTGFLNNTMPLIRYKTGDLCNIAEDGLITITGRYNPADFLIGKNDEKISHAVINCSTSLLSNVIDFQFYQEEKGKFDLMVVVNKNFNAADMEVLTREINKRTKNVLEFNVKQVEHLELSSRGKSKRVISKIK